ncbi:MAG: aminotransferase class I/II-fold pyridoxal phosphate-dependent enzyme [Christensenellales bacterium]|jgi:arginine decarboxylase
MDQTKAPLKEALKSLRARRVVPFDVPGHKQGKGNPDLVEFLGKQCLSVDVNSMKPLDNMCHPKSVIKEAEELTADAFGAKEAFFIVNGTTQAVQAMIMSVLKEGDKIIMPRNVHRSAINSLVISGAQPVYVNPGINKTLGIPLGMQLKEVEKAITANPDAKAVFVNNPTYYGICSNLKAIVDIAHSKGMKVLVDEAHGTHFYFGSDMPVSAMAAGADMAAVSMHKTGGSLTQSSVLLSNGSVDPGYIRQIINLTGTTSSSYLLMVSLDITRRYLALKGREIFDKVVKLSNYARAEINKIGGYYAFSKELTNGDSIYDFDETKLSVYTRDIGLAGIEIYDILRDEYGMQVEFGDLTNILAIISIGDSYLEIERLVSALQEIKRLYSGDKSGLFDREYINPRVVYPPKRAFYSDKKSVLIGESEGLISAEFVMSYPPGIPILAPGERITSDIIEYIKYAKEKGCLMTGTQDMDIEYINVMEE